MKPPKGARIIGVMAHRWGRVGGQGGQYTDPPPGGALADFEIAFSQVGGGGLGLGGWMWRGGGSNPDPPGRSAFQFTVKC